jgi:hypothetical protein
MGVFQEGTSYVSFVAIVKNREAMKMRYKPTISYHSFKFTSESEGNS